MSKQTPKEKLKAWFESGEAQALIKIYPHSAEAGTYGTREDLASYGALMDKRGILLPGRFEEYMTELQTELFSHQPSERTDKTLQFLQSTLGQMYDSLNLGDGTVLVGDDTVTYKQLYKKAGEMGQALAEYCEQIGLPALGAGSQSGRRRRGRE